MWKNKLFRTNTTNGKILILRIVRTYENIIKEFFMCISINQVSHEKGWKRDGSSETSERMILVWQSDSDKFRLRYRTTEPYSLSLGTTTTTKKWCSQLEESLTVYSWAGQFLSTCHNLRSTRKQVTQVRNCLHKIVPEYVCGVFSCLMIIVIGPKPLWVRPLMGRWPWVV